MKRLILLFTILIFGITTNSQEKKHLFIKAKDFINARLTFLMLSEYVKSDSLVISHWKYIKPDLEAVSANNIIAYKDLSELLNPNFKKTDTKLSSQINVIDIDKYLYLSPSNASEQLVSEAFTILDRAYPTIHNEISNNKPDLVMAVNKIITIQDVSPVMDDTLSAPVNVFKDERESVGFFSLKNLNFWLLLFSLLSIGSIVFIYSKLNARLDNHREYIQKLLTESESQNNGNSKNVNVATKEFQRYKELVENKISEINTAIQNIHREISKDDSVNKRNDFTPIYNSENTRIQDNIFYMGSPSNNYFPLTAKSNSKENTLYKFTIKNNPNEADFEVINDGAPIGQAVNHASNYFEPACNPENSPKNTVTKITTKSPGKAIFDGEKWNINTKAVIRYE